MTASPQPSAGKIFWLQPSAGVNVSTDVNTTTNASGAQSVHRRMRAPNRFRPCIAVSAGQRRARAHSIVGSPPPLERPDHVAIYVVVVLVIVALVGVVMSLRVIKQYERVVLFELGKVKDEARGPGLIFIVPFIDRVHRVSLRIITMPIQSQGIITKDNVSIDVSAVAYYRVEDPVRSVIAIENVEIGDQPDRPDHAARGGRASHARRDAV